MKYKLTNDYEIVPVSTTGGARTQTMNEYLKMKREVEAYLKNGKSPQKGGFLFDLVKAVGTMVKNGVEHKPAFKGVFGKGKTSGLTKPKRKVSAKMKQRGELIKQVMKKHKVTLPQASKMLKEAGY